MNSFIYQTSPKTAIHLPGDRLVRGNQPVRPSDTPPVVGLVVTPEEVAAVADITSMAQLKDTDAHRFGPFHSQTYKPPVSFYTQGRERQVRNPARRRPFTPDSRGMASVVELETLAQAEEFFAEAMERLEAQFEAGTTDYHRLAEASDEAAAAPPARRRTARGAVDFGDLVQA